MERAAARENTCKWEIQRHWCWHRQGWRRYLFDTVFSTPLSQNTCFQIKKQGGDDIRGWEYLLGLWQLWHIMTYSRVIYLLGLWQLWHIMTYFFWKKHSLFCNVLPHPRWQIHNFVMFSRAQDGKYTILFCFPASKMANSLFCYVFPHPRWLIHSFVMFSRIQDSKFTLLSCFPASKMANSLFCFVFPHPRWQIHCFVIVSPHPRWQIHSFVMSSRIQDGKFRMLLCFPASKMANSLCRPASKIANSLFCFVFPHPRWQLHYFDMFSRSCFPASKMEYSLFCHVFPHPR